MKVLFAVSNEEITDAIVKKYQKEYKEIISYKNVYYFNAILKELQKDKLYDRVVVSEELEEFTHSQYTEIDKFIFEKLDSISDEATNVKGEDIPIILISTDRRVIGDQMLNRLFGIGVYDVLIGNKRSVDEVCERIKKPRTKKEAKIYYGIDTEGISYEAVTENDVSEDEIQNILKHYKSLGKNEERYVDSFNNIAEQYNDIQLRIIGKCLPLNVKVVLEEKSIKYQQIMTFTNKSVSKAMNKKNGTVEKLLKSEDKKKEILNSVVIPSNINIKGKSKLIKEEPVVEPKEQTVVEKVSEVKPNIEQIVEPIKKKRGRPKKVALEKAIENTLAPKEEIIKKPKKKKLEDTFDEILPGIGNSKTSKVPKLDEPILDDDDMLPGLDELIAEVDETNVLPGLEDGNAESETLPGLALNSNEIINKEHAKSESEIKEQDAMIKEIREDKNGYKQYDQKKDLTEILTKNKKIAAFIGTTKNGVSFVVNNVAQVLADLGNNVAILDATKNRNAYFIYTDNNEELRTIASKSIAGLANGVANGVRINKNLSIYTSTIQDSDELENVDEILETLVKNHDVVLIDCDFETYYGYFKQSQEIFLIQTYDILTIQPLTYFLKELKAYECLEESKIKIIINKAIAIPKINEKTIIGGIAYYKDPAMSFMTELFDRADVEFMTIPLDMEAYAKYLDGVINCNISYKKYSKVFMQKLSNLAGFVYSVNKSGISKGTKYTPPSAPTSAFTSDMNNTLNQMKNSM